MTWAFMLDVSVCLLLIATITSATILNRRIGRLRNDRAELEKAVEEFRDATEQAASSIESLSLSTKTMDEKMQAARTLCDDLTFLTERAESAADRLEREIRTGRAAKPADPTSPPRRARPAAAKSARGSGEPAPASEAERALVAALRAQR